MQAPQNLRCAAQRDKIKQIAFFLGIKIRKTFAADLFFNNGIPFAAGIAFPPAISDKRRRNFDMRIRFRLLPF